MAEERTPVSWLVVERGWKIVASDGSEPATVQEVVGDSGKDIFDGLKVSPGVLSKPRYVPAERVRTITEGRVEIDLTADEIERLPEYQEPAASEEILPLTASRWQRFQAWFRR